MAVRAGLSLSDMFVTYLLKRRLNINFTKADGNLHSENQLTGNEVYCFNRWP